MTHFQARFSAPPAIALATSGIETDCADVIAYRAPISARDLLDQGWIVGATAYSVEYLPGDLEAAETLLGRKFSHDEIVALEKSIRHYLVTLSA